MRPLYLFSTLLLFIGCEAADMSAPDSVEVTDPGVVDAPRPDAEQVMADALAQASAQDKLLFVHFASPG